MQPSIYFASDHAGFELKGELVGFVRDILGYEVIDCGAVVYDENDDFTDFIAKAAREVSANPAQAKAIILGGSGQGEAMLANRFHDVRAAVYYGGDLKIIELSRTHNDANMLSLGARFITAAEAKEAVALWLHTVHVPVAKYDRRIEEMETFAAKESARTDRVLAVSKEQKERSLVPSLPAESFAQIASLLDSLHGLSSGIQIDIVDGIFAPSVSWPFAEGDVQEELRKLSPYAKDLELEIDCMCMDPEQYQDIFAELGISRMVLHAGSTKKYDECFVHAKKHGYRIGLGIRNTTPAQLLAAYADAVDFVQVMGIEHIGVQGEPFDASTLDTIARIRKEYPHMEIAVDGGVSEATIESLLAAGADRFAPGSAISRSSDPRASYIRLAKLASL